MSPALFGLLLFIVFNGGAALAEDGTGAPSFRPAYPRFVRADAPRSLHHTKESHSLRKLVKGVEEPTKASTTTTAPALRPQKVHDALRPAQLEPLGPPRTLPKEEKPRVETEKVERMAKPKVEVEKVERMEKPQPVVEADETTFTKKVHEDVKKVEPIEAAPSAPHHASRLSKVVNAARTFEKVRATPVAGVPESKRSVKPNPDAKGDAAKSRLNKPLPVHGAATAAAKVDAATVAGKGDAATVAELAAKAKAAASLARAKAASIKAEAAAEQASEEAKAAAAKAVAMAAKVPAMAGAAKPVPASHPQESNTLDCDCVHRDGKKVCQKCTNSSGRVTTTMTADLSGPSSGNATVKPEVVVVPPRAVPDSAASFFRSASVKPMAMPEDPPIEIDKAAEVVRKAEKSQESLARAQAAVAKANAEAKVAAMEAKDASDKAAASAAKAEATSRKVQENPVKPEDPKKTTGKDATAATAPITTSSALNFKAIGSTSKPVAKKETCTCVHRNGVKRCHCS